MIKSEICGCTIDDSTEEWQFYLCALHVVMSDDEIPQWITLLSRGGRSAA